MEKLKVFTAFSGYDSQCMALDRIKIDYELVGWSEIDKYVIKAHNAVYPQYADRNFGDITKIDWDAVPQIDLFTYSFPCTNISIAGKQAGFDKSSGTASSLLWECEKCIVIKRPKYLLMENVAALVSKKFIGLFNKWQDILVSYGYHNYVAILNAKDYGIPQNRKRVFMVSKLDNEPYFFPEPIELQTRLKDVLEHDVDNKFYLSDESIRKFIKQNEENITKDSSDSSNCTKYQRLRDTIQKNPIQDDGDSVFIDAYNKRIIKEEAGSITTRINDANMVYVTEPSIMQIGNIVEVSRRNPQRGRIYSIEGCSPCINAKSGGNLEPKILCQNTENKI